MPDLHMGVWSALCCLTQLTSLTLEGHDHKLAHSMIINVHDLSRVIHLQQLSLSGLPHVDDCIIPATLRHLVSLNLRGTVFKRFAVTHGHASLVELRLRAESMTCLPSDITSLVGLTALSLGGGDVALPLEQPLHALSIFSHLHS